MPYQYQVTAEDPDGELVSRHVRERTHEQPPDETQLSEGEDHAQDPPSHVLGDGEQAGAGVVEG